MTAGDAAPADDLDGLALDEAVDAVVAADGERDRDAVREALERVSDDGVVRRSAADDAIEGLTEGVTTARNAVNAAAMEFRNLEDAAAPIQDVDVVRARIGEFRGDVERIVARVDDLGERLDDLEARADDPDALYDFAADVERASADADDLGSAATRLSTAVNDFAEWVDEPEVWVNELQYDLGALEDTVESVEAVADELAPGAETGDGEHDEDGGKHDEDGGRHDETGGERDEAGDDSGEEAPAIEDPGVAWLDATLRSAVVELMIEDVETELSGLQEVADRGAMEDDWYPDLVADDLEDLADRRDRVADRLDELAEPAWTERFEDRLADFEAAIDGREPPIDWVALQETLEEFRLRDEEQ